MFSLGLLIVAAVLASASAYSTGAPKLGMNLMMNSMCTSGNLRPNHREHNRQVMPQAGPAPYTLVVENANVPYGPGTRVTVKLSAKPGKTFRGFFITGDGEDAKTGFTGSFEAGPTTNAQPTQFCSGGITHKDKLDKTSVTIFWNPPANYTHGTVQFKATVVENFNTFYTGVLSNVINPVINVDKQSVFAQKKMQRMMSSLPGMLSGQGGQGGMMNFGDMMKQMQNMMPNLPKMPGMSGMPGMPGMSGMAGRAPPANNMGGMGGFNMNQPGGMGRGLGAMGNFFRQ